MTQSWLPLVHTKTTSTPWNSACGQIYSKTLILHHIHIQHFCISIAIFSGGKGGGRGGGGLL